MLNTSTSIIILDCQIKTCDRWVAGVDFLRDSDNERAVSAMALPKRNNKNQSETITHITTKILSIQVTGTFKPCEDCALGKAKQ